MSRLIQLDGTVLDLDDSGKSADGEERTVFLSQVAKLTGYRDEDWKDREKAQSNYERYRSIDPYPDILPALLNSADIIRYVAKTGMLCPFKPDDLQGATYEVAIKGRVVYWDGEGNKQVTFLENPSDSFVLQKNSIAFVTLEPFFRIPDYMALRFNLKISHVYKGLLLGTGPIVDPGFQGHLSIPLHNLTSNEYRFYAGDGIIKMEFTKLSHHWEWDDPARIPEDLNKQLVYRRNFIRPGRTVDDYIAKALHGNTSSTVVRSSIPDEIDRVNKKSDETTKELTSFKEDTEKRQGEFREDIEGRLHHVQIVNVATILAIAAMVVSILGFTWNVISRQADSADVENTKAYQMLEQKYDDLDQRYDDLRDKYDQLLADSSGDSR